MMMMMMMMMIPTVISMLLDYYYDYYYYCIIIIIIIVFVIVQSYIDVPRFDMKHFSMMPTCPVALERLPCHCFPVFYQSVDVYVIFSIKPCNYSQNDPTRKEDLHLLKSSQIDVGQWFLKYKRTHPEFMNGFKFAEFLGSGRIQCWWSSHVYA